MTTFLVIVLAVVWTLLVLIAGYYFGWENHKKEIDKQEPLVLPHTYNFNQDLNLTPEQMDDIADTVKTFLGDKAYGKDGSQGPPGPSFLEEDLEEYHMTGAEWIEHVMGRLSRVERKSGMSV